MISCDQQTTVGTFDRRHNLAQIGSCRFDVLVIGGGITGCGIALDAASRGLHTALVEREDFASGTSSKSSKLVHGGLRYLQSGDVRVVHEALRERRRLLENAPHLVRILPILLPRFTRTSRRHDRALGLALWLYDLLGSARVGRFHRRLTVDEAIELMPTLRPDELRGAYLCYDGQADDARLTLQLARTAALDFGAVVVNRAPVVELLRESDRNVCGAVIESRPGGRIEVHARVVVNATGVWSDRMRALDEGHDPASLRPAKGVHITVPWQKVLNRVTVVVTAPSDGRRVFVVPWLPRPDGTFATSYVGTTDSDYHDSIDTPGISRAEIDYLLEALNATIDDPLVATDVLGSWAGLRPLLNDPAKRRSADMSRRHAVEVSSSGVVSISGGKLTTYRQMAQDTVDEVVARLGPDRARAVKPCQTKHLVLRGGRDLDQVHAQEMTGTIPPAVVRHLIERYGGEASTVLAGCEHDPSLAEPLIEGLPYVRAEAVYAVRHEMATTLDDVLTRRTRALLVAREATVGAAAGVARLIAADLGWSDTEAARQLACFRDLVACDRSVGEPHDEPIDDIDR